MVGEFSVTGKNAQFLVEGLIAKDIVNVTIQFQKMEETIVPLMAQRMSKQRDVMKIHVQVGRLIRIILILIPSNRSYDDIFSKYNLCFCKFLR